MFIKLLLFWTLGVGDLCLSKTTSDLLESRKSKAWIATFNGTCSESNMVGTRSTLSDGACVTLDTGNSNGWGNMMGGSWGDLTSITAYGGDDSCEGQGQCACSIPVTWTMTRTGEEAGFCEPQSGFSSSVKGSIVQQPPPPPLPQTDGVQHDNI